MGRVHYLNEGETYAFAFRLRDFTVADLVLFDKHKLSGTPYDIAQALMVVGDCAVRAYLHDSDMLPETDLDAIIEGDVTAYLCDDVDGDDETLPDFDEDFSRMCSTSFNALSELYAIVAQEIQFGLYDRIEFRDGLGLVDIRVHGYDSIGVVVEAI